MQASKPLTPKQARFVQEYLIDLNATQAAIRAGYSEKSAYSQGQRLLKNVEAQAAIQKAQQNRTESTKWNAQKVLDRLVMIADLDVLDIVADDGSLRPIRDWPKEWRMSISGLDVMEMGSGDDVMGLVKKIKWPDRLRNLELLGKHIDIRAFSEKQDATADHEAQMTELMRRLGGNLPN